MKNRKHRKHKRQTKHRRKIENRNSKSETGEARRLANLTGGTSHERKRRHYKVDRLPPSIQQMIAEQYAGGASFREIAQRVGEAGHRIGKDAIRKYWHAVWREEHEALRRGRLALVVMKRALQLEPESESGKVAEEMLYTLLCGKVKEIGQQPWDVLLHEAREQQKTSGGKKKPAAKKVSSVEQAREIRRRWRRLYGLDDADEETEEKS